MGSILSVDYGKKRIGLAISDPSHTFAFPFGVIENKSFDFVLSKIKAIVSEREIEIIVIGLPYNMNISDKSKDISENEMTRAVNGFVENLRKVLNIKIETFDERLSSFSAEENLKECGISAKKSKHLIDQEAARLILIDFIQNLENKKG